MGKVGPGKHLKVSGLHSRGLNLGKGCASSARSAE